MVLNLLFIFSFINSSIFIDLSVQVSQSHFFCPVWVIFSGEKLLGPEGSDVPVSDFDNIFFAKTDGC